MVGMALWYAVSPRTGWRTGLMLVAFAVVNLGSTDLMPRAWYRAYYVPYLLKTVPLIPLWIVMQLELHGFIANRGASVRVPHSFVNDNYRGYLEDRRPNSQGDPYKIASRILQTIATVPTGAAKKGKK